MIGVEPELAADARQSLREGRIVSWPAADVTRTICDGVRTQALGELTFAIISALVDEIVTVPDDAVLDAMRWLRARGEARRRADRRADARSGADRCGEPRRADGAVVSGGNVDPGVGGGGPRRR